jgi:ABC-type maltose transport system permease subunit
MKRTKSIIVFTITMFTSLLFFAFIGYIVSGSTYQECLQSNGLILFMLMLGWIPALAISIEYYELQCSKEYQDELKLAEKKSQGL